MVLKPNVSLCNISSYTANVEKLLGGRISEGPKHCGKGAVHLIIWWRANKIVCYYWILLGDKGSEEALGKETKLIIFATTNITTDHNIDFDNYIIAVGHTGSELNVNLNVNVNQQNCHNHNQFAHNNPELIFSRHCILSV